MGVPRKLPDEPDVYGLVVSEARARGIPFALGGAFAFGTYTGIWRNTKDLDIYTLPRHREAFMEVLSHLGLTDYYDQLPYDRRWIYRSYSNDNIVDVIWAMANQRSQVDDVWIGSGRETALQGQPVRAIPAEELLWSKLYVLQRDRCDWGDVLNLIYKQGPELNWRRLLERLGDDAPLLAGALCIFRWIAPGRARQLPEWLWPHLRVFPPEAAEAEIECRNVDLLDSRPWFAC